MHDGTAYGFGINEQSKPSIFVDTIFRAAELENRDGETVDDLYGIKLLRFRIQKKDLINAFHDPANAVYDSWGPDGVLNLTKPSGFPL